MDGLYHIDYKWDTKFVHYTYRNICEYARIGVSYSNHYTEQVKARKMPRIPNLWELLNGKVIEVEIINNEVVKALIRTRFSMKDSIITVIRFEKNGILYITGWVNNIKDTHRTLDNSKYVKREEDKLCV